MHVLRKRKRVRRDYAVSRRQARVLFAGSGKSMQPHLAGQADVAATPKDSNAFFGVGKKHSHQHVTSGEPEGKQRTRGPLGDPRSTHMLFSGLGKSIQTNIVHLESLRASKELGGLWATAKQHSNQHLASGEPEGKQATRGPPKLPIRERLPCSPDCPVEPFRKLASRATYAFIPG